MLKETIDKTRELTNNVHTAKEKINNVIVRGGGCTFRRFKWNSAKYKKYG